MKPVKRVKEAYDWLEVEHYLNEKHGCRLRNFANKVYRSDDVSDNPYQNYWHHIIKWSEINNGCYFSIDYDWLEFSEESWQKEITTWILDEFGEYEPFTGKSAEFWVEW